MQRIHSAPNPSRVLLKALGHPVRLAIVEVLAKGERNVGQIAAATETPQAIASQQLKILRDFDILASRRDGNRTYYRIAQPAALKALACLRKSLPDA